MTTYTITTEDEEEHKRFLRAFDYLLALQDFWDHSIGNRFKHTEPLGDEAMKLYEDLRDEFLTSLSDNDVELS